MTEVSNLRLTGLKTSHAWFTSHDDSDIREFAVNALATPYVYASWEKKEMFLQTQKMPDENYVRDATNAILRLQLKKSKKVIDQLKQFFENAQPEEQDSEEYMLNVKVLQVVQNQRNELAAKLGTVIY